MKEKNTKFRKIFLTCMMACLCLFICSCGQKDKPDTAEEAGTEADGSAFENESAETAALAEVTETPTPKPTLTPENTPTVTPSPSVTPTETPAPSPTETPEPSPTETPLPSPTETPEPSPTETPEPSPTETPAPSTTETTPPTPTEIPSLSPTEKPDQSSLEDQAIIKKPDHPETISNEKLIFIGDSRTVGMYHAVRDGSVWSCRSAMGYDWMTSTGVPQIESEIESGTAVIILMGVNDPHNVNNYISYINTKANEWSSLGATTYFVSVGPVTSDPYVTNAEIESFNEAMQANLAGVYYIDVYSYLMGNGFATTDGIHYTEDVYREIYNYILDNLQEQRSGIWG